MQICKPIRAAFTLRTLLLSVWTGANKAMLSDNNILRWQMICAVKVFGEPTCIAGLHSLKNASCVAYALSEECSLQIRNPLDLVGLRIAVLSILASIWFFNCEVIKTESSDWCQYFARPPGLAIIALWCSLDYFLQQTYSFVTYNNKARCKKSFLVVKMQFQFVWIESSLEWSWRQHRKLFKLWKEQFFSFIYSGPSPSGLQYLQSK